MGFYIPCAYCVIKTGNAHPTINEIIITDPNSYFFMPDNPQQVVVSAEERTPAQFQAAARSAIGDQFDLLSLFQKMNFNQQPGTRYGIYKYGRTWFPSAELYAPNLANYYSESATGSWYGGILFNNGEYLIHSNWPDYILRKDANNQYHTYLTASGDTASISFGAIGQGVRIPILYGQYSDSTDLTTARFGAISADTNSTSTRSTRISATSAATTSFWNLLFSVVYPAPTKPQVSDCVITVQPYTNSYTGDPITPEVTVVSIDQQSGTYNYLSEDSDYTLTFSNNINPGTATVTITGINNWGGSVTKSFEIVTTTRFPIVDCSVALSPTTFTYDGTAKRPNATVTRLDTSTTPPTVITLVQNRDYRLTYRNNVEITNHAEVDITGINSYTGTRTETFRIVSADQDVSNWLVDYDRGPYDYTGSPIEVGYIGVQTPEYSVLVKDEDYTITYFNNTNIGQAYFIVQGIGYYSGSQRCPFYIVGDSQNPYGPQSESEPGGGDGDNDYSTTPIPAGQLPTLSPANSGLTRIYVPTLSQLSALGQYLWYTDSTWETIWNHVKEMVGSLSEAIIGLNFIPFEPQIGGAEVVKVLLNNTGVTMNYAASQWAEVDCGTCKVTTQAGSFLDYAPYTSVDLFLPFIGTVQLDTDEVMGKTLHVVYRFDIVSGSCTAVVEVDGDVFYQFSGHAAIACPVTSANFSEYISAAIGVASAAVQVATGAGIAVASGGIAAALTSRSETVSIQTGGGSTTHSTTTVTQQSRNPTTGRMINTDRTIGIQNTATNRQDTTRTSSRDYLPSPATQASFLGLNPGQMANTVGNIIGSKPHTAHSGAFSGNSGFLGERKCFLTIKRPKQALPNNYASVAGYPCMMWKNFGELIGFTKIHSVQLSGLTATQNELDEILQLLKTGVIL